MTGLDNILKKIELDAKERADVIKAEADVSVKKLIGEAETEARKISENYAVMADEKAKTVLERAQAADESDAKRAVLGKKQELIKETLNVARREIREAKTTEYFRFLESLLELNVQKGDGKVIMAEKDIREMPTEFEAALARCGLKAEAGEIESRSGFVIVYGNIEINCTVDAVFDARSEELSDSLNGFLFGSEGGI